MARVQNTQTGQVLDIPDDQLGAISAQWKPVDANVALQSAANTPGGNEAYYAIIDADPTLTPDEKNLAKFAIDNYSGGGQADAQDILNTFNKIKATTIDPHFADLANQATYALKNNLASLNAYRGTELTAQGTNAAELARSTAKNLDATGGALSGENVRQFGSGTKPVFGGGGAPIEGLVPQQNRLMASDTLTRYQDSQRNLYNTAEQALGTQGVAGIGGYTPIGGVTGSINTAKTGAEATALSDIAAQKAGTNALTKAQPNPSNIPAL